jgi:hypothetical protein
MALLAMFNMGIATSKQAAIHPLMNKNAAACSADVI